MEITDVETYALRVPMDTPASDSRISFSERWAIVVEIDTDEGYTGTGWLGSTRAGDVFKRLIDSQFVDLLPGRDPFATEAIWQDLRDHTVYYGETGLSMYPRAAIDVALWDIKAKAAGQPLYKLLGGEDDRIRAYASSLDAQLSLEELAERHGTHADQGFTAFKTKVGDKPLKEEAERIRTVRETVGPDADIFIDSNQAWTVTETIRIVDRLDEYNLGWVEEPISEWDLDGHRRINERIRPPLATGEMFYRPERFRYIVDRGGLDVLQPDFIRAGGVTGMLRVADLAQQHAIPLAPHANYALSGHVVSAAPTGWLVEYFTGHDMQADIFEDPPTVSDGHLHLPDEPGHGYRIDPDARTEYEVTFD